MKTAVLQTIMGLPVAAAIALAALPAHAQYYSVPLSNGSFTLVPNAAGTGNEFSGPITLLSPVGTIAVTGNPSIFGFQFGIPINNETPIGVFMEGITGSVNLRDGRTAKFGPESSVGVEALATVSGTSDWNPYTVLPTGASATFAIRNGYLSFPEANLTAYPTPQFSIPVTNGTAFRIDVPVGAAPETFTVLGALSPIGTVNLALTYPLLVNPENSYLYYTVQETDTPIRLGGVINGKVNLPDGRVATLDNLPVSLAATARVTVGTGPFTQPDVYDTPVTIEGTLTGGSISVPESAVGLPSPPPSTPDTPPTNPSMPTGNSPQPIPETAIPSDPVLSRRPVPLEVVSPSTPPILLGFTQRLELGGELNEFVSNKLETTPVQEIPEVDRSSLEFSRIHPAVNVYN